MMNINANPLYFMAVVCCVAKTVAIELLLSSASVLTNAYYEAKYLWYITAQLLELSELVRSN